MKIHGCGCSFLSFVAFAAIALTIFAVILHTGMKPDDNMLQIQAVISDVEETESYDAEGDLQTDTTFYVDYTVGDTQYRRVRLNYSSPSMKVGKEITIFYDPSDPTRIMADVHVLRTVFTVGAAVCWILLAGGVIALTVLIRRMHRGGAV